MNQRIVRPKGILQFRKTLTYTSFGFFPIFFFLSLKLSLVVLAVHTFSQLLLSDIVVLLIVVVIVLLLLWSQRQQQQ